MSAIGLILRGGFELRVNALVEIAFTNLRQLGNLGRLAEFAGLNESLLLFQNGLKDLFARLLLEKRLRGFWLQP